MGLQCIGFVFVASLVCLNCDCLAPQGRSGGGARRCAAWWGGAGHGGAAGQGGAGPGRAGPGRGGAGWVGARLGDAATGVESGVRVAVTRTWRR